MNKYQVTFVKERFSEFMFSLRTSILLRMMKTMKINKTMYFIRKKSFHEVDLHWSIS
jgi:hypothetical protein